MSTPERPELSASPASIAAPPHRVVKSQRILACLLCQQRKVKCDRKFPCANCTKSHSQCVPGSTLVAHQRRRRFPERELLSRLRHYEDLLRKHNISFDPLHSGSSNVEDGNADGEPEEAVVVDPLGASIKAPSMTVKYASNSKHASKPALTLYGSVWRAINGRVGFLFHLCPCRVLVADKCSSLLIPTTTAAFRLPTTFTRLSQKQHGTTFSPVMTIFCSELAKKTSIQAPSTPTKYRFFAYGRRSSITSTPCSRSYMFLHYSHE